ncbi:MipA/OmpV family protein [Paracoccus aerodenitrificans]|uniref:MipA/OmpV family protein n=1 Tax=Paracoccus aerodenitrificans TaxID=3017781 RepID=UPI0022F01CA9|nr:MipA/OmpV family protein [Paracoccus aerodenitrificans]WBU62918.1 MipA/OmpV family protein [Paracoccus aerodenitrificans]
MKIVLPLIVAASVATPTLAQSFDDATVVNRRQSVSLDVGLGAAVKPTYPGSDETDVVPWFILRNLEINDSTGREQQGFSFAPNLGYIGERDEDDDDRLLGLDDIDPAYEVGVRVSYHSGPMRSYLTLRKGFGGHEGLTGEFGTEYRIDASDRLTLWAGLEAGYGDDEFNDTYFGISATDASFSDYSEYSPGGGINSASAKLEARYDLTPKTALLGEVKYTRIIGDAADSPITLDEDQPSVRLGIVRKLNFEF